MIWKHFSTVTVVYNKFRSAYNKCSLFKMFGFARRDRMTAILSIVHNSIVFCLRTDGLCHVTRLSDGLLFM